MEPSLRIVPAAPSKTAAISDTAGSYGLHDTLQYGPRSIAAEVKTTSDIKHRIENWDETQDNLKLTLQRREFGLHMPMRQLMERKIVGYNPHMPTLSRSNIHLDILMGRDEVIEPADFMTGGAEMQQPFDIHGEMEKKLRM